MNSGDIMKKPIAIITFIILVVTLLLTVGYAAFSDQLTITGGNAIVRANVEVRGTGVTTNSSYVSNLDYRVSKVINDVSLPAGESITYTITARNLGPIPVAISNVSFSSGGNAINTITSNIDSTNFERICDTNNNCETNVVKTFNLTITNNGSTLSNTDLDIDFTFTPFYTITYNTEAIGYALSGGTFTYEFPSNPPSSVTIDSGTAGTPQLTTDNNVTTMTINNITSDLVLTGTTSGASGSGTWSDPYQLDDNNYHYNDLDAGSYKFINLPGEPEITVDANHKVTKYELQNCGTGLALNGGSMESGILAFDNQKITINMEFTTNFSNSGNYYKCLVSALSSTNNSTYSGFRVTNKKNGMMYVHTMNNQSIASNGTGGYQIIDYSISNTYSKKDTRYTMTIVYDPSNENLTITINPGSINETGSITSITTAMRNATITIGGNGINTNNNMAQLTVHGLTVTKG